MSSYSRIFLHFVHAITNDRDRVHTFLFGTRLTNITRHLRHRDVDVALGKVVAAVEDWSGGTRIGKVLEEFNNRWSRRVLGQGALVLLVSDGLDRDAGAGLEAQIERLHKSCRRLIWLNPLLRYDAFEARASGIRAMISPRRRFPAGAQSREPHRPRGRTGVGARARPWGGGVPTGRCGNAGRVGRGTGMTDVAGEDILEAAAAWRAADKGVALATVVSTWGSSPRPVGSQLAVDETGSFVGSVSGGCIEGAVVHEALDVITGGEPRLLAFGVSNSRAWEVGLACGGRVEVYVERIE